MKRLPISSVKKWGAHKIYSIPSSISTTCPHCDAMVTFTLQKYSSNMNDELWSALSNCPSCDETSIFVTLEPSITGSDTPKDPAEICMHPTPSAWRQQIPLTDNVPEALQRAFSSTVDAYNSKNYVATAVCCRRTLEGIFKYRVNASKQKLPLMKLIEEVKNSQDLSEPLNSLSHAIRAGGNLGAHFDEALEPNHDMAKHMVELLEYLISYLYILPEQISRLDSALNKEA